MFDGIPSLCWMCTFPLGCFKSSETSLAKLFLLTKGCSHQLLRTWWKTVSINVSSWNQDIKSSWCSTLPKKLIWSFYACVECWKPMVFIPTVWLSDSTYRQVCALSARSCRCFWDSGTIFSHHSLSRSTSRGGSAAEKKRILWNGLLWQNLLLMCPHFRFFGTLTVLGSAGAFAWRLNHFLPTLLENRVGKEWWLRTSIYLSFTPKGSWSMEQIWGFQEAMQRGVTVSPLWNRNDPWAAAKSSVCCPTSLSSQKHLSSSAEPLLRGQKHHEHQALPVLDVSKQINDTCSASASWAVSSGWRLLDLEPEIKERIHWEPIQDDSSTIIGGFIVSKCQCLGPVVLWLGCIFSTSLHPYIPQFLLVQTNPVIILDGEWWWSLPRFAFFKHVQSLFLLQVMNCSPKKKSRWEKKNFKNKTWLRVFSMDWFKETFTGNLHI